MNTVVSIPAEKKLLLTYRVEPGCLGPDGMSYINDFCKHAGDAFINHHSNYVVYQFIPRYEKSLAEMEFSINNQRLSEKKAGQYMSLFAQTLEGFEEDLQNQLTSLIEMFFDR
jgi:hypothetical protein